MTHKINRRDFLKRCTALVGSLATSPLLKFFPRSIAIWIDTIGGGASAAAYEDDGAKNSVNTFADATALAATLGACSSIAPSTAAPLIDFGPSFKEEK